MGLVQPIADVKGLHGATNCRGIDVEVAGKIQSWDGCMAEIYGYM